jgi:hypothetical protein
MQKPEIVVKEDRAEFKFGPYPKSRGGTNPPPKNSSSPLSDHSCSENHLIALFQRSAAESISAAERRLKKEAFSSSAATSCNYTSFPHPVCIGPTTELPCQNSLPLHLGVQQPNFFF